MKSDKSRDTFLPEKHLSSVRLQQGRVLTDADWNEQVDIQRHLDEVSNRDIIGPTGVPLVIGLDAAPNEDGFKIDPPSGSATDLQIRHGRIYVDGILCELEATTGYTTQPDFPSPPPISDLAEGVLIVAYLDVWHRHIGTIEDPTIREVALGGPDTATRAKTIWQVKLLQTSATTNVDHEATPEWQALVARSTGKLNARAQEPSPADTPCVVPPEAGFRRLENQLYRVEIHTPGSIGPGATGDPPTFKWSRDNGSVVARWLELIVAEDKIRVELPTRDETRGFSPGQWIELSDERSDLHGEPGILVKLLDVDGDLLTFNPVTASGNIEAFFTAAINPKVRRWDMTDGAIFVPAPVADPDGGYIELEDGVEVRFELDPDAATPDVATYHVGDFWLIPARTITGDILWPRQQSGGTIIPLAQRPAGIRHHFTCLASFFLPGFTNYRDCRKKFPPLTDLPGGTPTDLPRPGQYRYYLVDGNITPTPTGVVGINDDPVLAHAAARPFPNITAVTNIFPRDGFDSIAVILIKALANGGTYDNFHLRGVHGYRNVLIRGSDLTNSIQDKRSAGAVRLAAFPDGITLANREGFEAPNVVRTTAPLPAEATLVGWRAHFSPGVTGGLGDQSFMVLGASNSETNGFLELTTLGASNTRAGDVVFLEEPGVKVADVDLEFDTDGRLGTTLVGLAAENINTDFKGRGIVGFCTAPTIQAAEFGHLQFGRSYPDETQEAGASVGFGFRTETLSASNGESLRIGDSFISTDVIDVQDVLQLTIATSHIRNSFISRCSRFSIGLDSPPSSPVTRLTRLDGLLGNGGLGIFDSNGQIISVRLDTNNRLGGRFINFAGNGQALSIIDTVMKTPMDTFLDLTSANGSEIILDGFAPNSDTLPLIEISGAIRLPGDGIIGIEGGDQPIELNATDVVDRRNNHIQGPGGSFVQKALALSASQAVPAYRVTMFDQVGSPARQKVVTAVPTAPDVTTRIAGVAQQALPGNTEAVAMHVVNGYSVVQLAIGVGSGLPTPVFLSSDPLWPGAVTTIAPTDAPQVRIGVLVQMFRLHSLGSLGLVRLETPTLIQGGA